MVEHEQVRPLAPVSDRRGSDEEAAASYLKKIRRRRCIRCCGIIAATFLIIAVIIIILIFTVFRIKDPDIKMNGFTISRLELNNGTIPKPGVNISIVADVSVKNPNVASFKYSNTTTTLFYRDTVAGEARGPPGRAKPRRTARMNITVDIIPDRLMANPNLNSDIASGLLNMTSYSKIPGRVKILGIIKRHVTVKMNCSVSVNFTSQAIQTMKCKRKVDL